MTMKRLEFLKSVRNIFADAKRIKPLAVTIGQQIRLPKTGAMDLDPEQVKKRPAEPSGYGQAVSVPIGEMMNESSVPFSSLLFTQIMAIVEPKELLKFSKPGEPEWSDVVKKAWETRKANLSSSVDTITKSISPEHGGRIVLKNGSSLIISRNTKATADVHPWRVSPLSKDGVPQPHKVYKDLPTAIASVSKKYSQIASIENGAAHVKKPDVAPTKDQADSKVAPQPAQVTVTPTLHEKIDKLSKATRIDHESIKNALLSKSATAANANIANVRARITGAIHKNGDEVKDAVLKVLELPHDDHRNTLLNSICVENVDRAKKEFAQTPLYDLQPVSKIAVWNHEIQGQANYHMGSRMLNMGTTSVTGDFRHELGHALRSALGGASYANKNEITQAIADHYKSVQQKIGANPEGIKTKMSHDWYEKNYGLIGRRGADNWEEDFAEHYRGYHREIYKDKYEGGNGKFLAQYREIHPAMAKIFDAHYTAALLQGELMKGGK